MKAAVIKNDKIEVKEFDDLLLNGRDGAVVKVLGCGLCGSDIVKFIHKISKDGTVLGHEIVAEILEINSRTNFKEGDIIVTSHHIPCGSCVYCKHGNVSMCEHFKSTNIYPGGFSEKVYLTEEHLENVAHLKPKSLTNIEASFYEPLGCIVRSVKRANLLKFDRTLVIGLETIGLLTSQTLKACGTDIVGCDLLEERIELAQKFGIKSVDVRKLDGEFDAVFMTSGADRAVETALKYIRNGGKIIVFSSTPHDETAYPNNKIYYRELTVMGSYSPSPADLKESLELLRTGQVRVNGLSTEYTLDEVQKAFDDTMSNKIMKAYISIGE